MQNRFLPSASLTVAMMMLLSFVMNFSALPVHGATPSDWSTRNIYQIITDRFNRGNNDTSDCNNLHDYCGGTFQGIIDQLNYISNLGFDAIWISPVVTNQPHEYHGYAAKDLYSINPHFGGEEGLINLSNALHERGMLLMVDVVANHMGIPPQLNNYTGVNPFNDLSYYHSCSGCPQKAGELCWIQNWSNHTEMQLCQLDGLPDLNQTNPFVRSQLLTWIQDLISTFGVDGLRIDTIPEVAVDFWTEFQNNAGIYAVGEVFNGNISWVASYQGPLDATLSYPLYFTLNSVFSKSSPDSFEDLSQTLQAYSESFTDVSILGQFLENHDNPRFLFDSPSVSLYKNGLLFNYMSLGISISYYGAEQLMTGGNDPLNRSPLWQSSNGGFNQSSEMYQWIATILQYKQTNNISQLDQVEQFYDDNVYTFSRGQTFVALTNLIDQDQVRTFSGDTDTPFVEGDVICNLFDPENDCIVVQANSTWTLVLVQGEPKVYYNTNASVQRQQQPLENSRPRFIRRNNLERVVDPKRLPQQQQQIDHRGSRRRVRAPVALPKSPIAVQ